MAMGILTDTFLQSNDTDSGAPVPESSPPAAPVMTLFIASGAPSAKVAASSLSHALEELGLADSAIDVIDVFSTPEKALEVGLVATPALLAEVSGRKTWFTGDLRHLEDLRTWIAGSTERSK